MSSRKLPIGVFDSGVGGLTVLAALRQRLPAEDLLYLGDTARVPYGTRSPETVVRYAERVAGHLLGQGIKALVVACNTATTWALPALQRTGQARGIPVVGVIEPGVERALEATRNGHVGVIGTEGTIQGGRYTAQLLAARPTLRVDGVACPMFVALAEEGWVGDDPIARLTAERYLAPLRGGPDTVILGCTHYPLLRAAIQAALPGATLVDSATATAADTAALLQAQGLLRADPGPGRSRFLVTDNPARFERVGRYFLDAPHRPEVVDIDERDHATWHGADWRGASGNGASGNGRAGEGP